MFFIASRAAFISPPRLQAAYSATGTAALGLISAYAQPDEQLQKFSEMWPLLTRYKTRYECPVSFAT